MRKLAKISVTHEALLMSCNPQALVRFIVEDLHRALPGDAVQLFIRADDQITSFYLVQTRDGGAMPGAGRLAERCEGRVCQFREGLPATRKGLELDNTGSDCGFSPTKNQQLRGPKVPPVGQKANTVQLVLRDKTGINLLPDQHLTADRARRDHPANPAKTALSRLAPCGQVAPG